MSESISGTEANQNHSAFIGMTRDPESGELKAMGHPTGITLPEHQARAMSRDVFAGHRQNCWNNLHTGILEMDKILDEMRFNFLTGLGVEPAPILPAGVWESIPKIHQAHLRDISAKKRLIAPLVDVTMFIGEHRNDHLLLREEETQS